MANNATLTIADVGTKFVLITETLYVGQSNFIGAVKPTDKIEKEFLIGVENIALVKYEKTSQDKNPEFKQLLIQLANNVGSVEFANEPSILEPVYAALKAKLTAVG